MDGTERWRVLRLHVEDQVPLTALARDTGISARTLQRWHHLYRTQGISALDPHPRAPWPDDFLDPEAGWSTGSTDAPADDDPEIRPF